MSELNSLEDNNSFGLWKKIEKIIKEKESMILLLLILGTLVFIPFKILSFGWNPPDDASRHIAFSTIDAKWSDVLVIDEKYDTDHNAGWHQVLKFLNKYCGFDKYDLMYFSVVGLFLLVNICGILVAPSPISWCIALLMMLNFDATVLFRLMFGRPYLVSCATTLVVLYLWSLDSEEYKPNFIKKTWVKYLLTIIALSLGVWIHGSWYIFLLIPISFFIAGRTKDSLKLTGCVLLSTVIGALLTGKFLHFLYYHFAVTFSIYSEPTFNWLLAKENHTGLQSIYWSSFAAIIILLCMKKSNYKLKSIGSDPVFIMVLLCWMGSIMIIRFWIDWGRMALLLWLSYRIHELIKSSYSLKNPRIRYCLSVFVLVCLTLCFINDYDGRYTKAALMQPVDFYNEQTLDKLKGWEPGDGGIIYSTSMKCFYQHFFMYPTAKWKYVLGFEPAIMKTEAQQIYRDIGYTGLEEAYTPWVKKMTENDRLILFNRLYTFPELEWIRGNRTWWVGRLKKKTPDSEVKTDTNN